MFNNIFEFVFKKMNEEDHSDISAFYNKMMILYHASSGVRSHYRNKQMEEFGNRFYEKYWSYKGRKIAPKSSLTKENYQEMIDWLEQSLSSIKKNIQKEMVKFKQANDKEEVENLQMDLVAIEKNSKKEWDSSKDWYKGETPGKDIRFALPPSGPGSKPRSGITT